MIFEKWKGEVAKCYIKIKEVKLIMVTLTGPLLKFVCKRLSYYYSRRSQQTTGSLSFPALFVERAKKHKHGAVFFFSFLFSFFFYFHSLIFSLARRT